MIPKIIHWIWFGDKNKIPDQFQQNLESWKRFFPDYEIKCWDESNYDINKNLFTKEQYEQGNYAFVSDFARLDIVCQYGGLYFDIDVEVIKPFDDLPEQFFGFDRFLNEEGKMCFGVNCGSGFRCRAGHPLIKRMIETFNIEEKILNRNYIQEDRAMVLTTTTEPLLTLKEAGLIANNKYQIIQGIHILPYQFLSSLTPYSSKNKNDITTHTVSIHKYAHTWLNDNVLKRRNNYDT
jgi:mannosyltransferase OCH1-like enzyme